MFLPKNNVANFNILESGLFQDIASKESKSIGHMSGFTYFDYPTAYCDKNGYNNTLLPNGGLFPRIYTCIGESGTGKTTTMIQLGGSIVDRHTFGTLVFIDPEGNCSPERIKSLNKWNDFQYRNKCLYIPPSPPITINDVYDIIRKVAHSKDGKFNKIGLVTPYKDIYTNKHIEIYPPTVIILDSVPALVISQSLEEQVDGKKEFKSIDQISNNIDAMREAKDNTNFLKKVKGLLDKYNIILIMINHIVKEVPMGMFDKPKKYHPNLKAGEKLKGGSEQIYQSFGLFKISQKEVINERNPIYGDRIRGAINNLDLIKNKSNISNNEFRIVFDKRTGYRPELSDFEYLLSRKFGISGSPMSMYLDILPEIKFTRKTLVSKCEEFPLLSRAISFLAKYKMGNDLIIMNKFGELNLNEFAELPLYKRISIILSTTIPYPIYSINQFDNTSIKNLEMLAFRGNMYTGMTGEYISPININILQKISSWSKRGYCICKNTGGDPIENILNK